MEYGEYGDYGRAGEAAKQEAQAIRLDAFRQRFDALVSNIAGVVVTSQDNLRLALLGLSPRDTYCWRTCLGGAKPCWPRPLPLPSMPDSRAFSSLRICFPATSPGTSVFDMPRQTFEFVPGPIFANIVLADELNRAGPVPSRRCWNRWAKGRSAPTAWFDPCPSLLPSLRRRTSSRATAPIPAQFPTGPIHGLHDVGNCPHRSKRWRFCARRCRVGRQECDAGALH